MESCPQTSSFVSFSSDQHFVLSLLFTEHHFSLPSHAGNTFLIHFMLYQWLFGVVTSKKCDETRVLSFPFLARSSEGQATWLVNRDDVHET